MLKCSACGRVDDDIGHCGSFVTCPLVGIPLEPTDIILQCDRPECGFTRVVSAGRIMQGKALVAASQCPITECEARAVFITDVSAPAEPVLQVDHENEPGTPKTSGRTKKGA